MDEFLDYFLSSSSWSEGNATERLSWVGNEPVQTNGLLPGSMRADMGDENNSSISMIPSSHMIESLVTQGSSMLVGGDVQPKQEGLDCGSKPSFPGVADSNSKAGYMSLQLNTNSLTQGTLNHCSPELLSTVSGSAKSPRAPPESGSVGSNDSEPSGFQPSLLDSQSLTSIPQLWPPPSYEGVSCLSSVMGQDKLQGFGLQGEYLDTNATNVLGNRYLGDDKILQIGNLPASLSVDEQDMLNNQCLSTFAAGHHIPLARTAGLHSQLQLLQSNEGNLIKHYTDQFPVSQLPQVPATSSGGCNGAAKPRVRARRGQATDPHSIAERLRREKIAERMKNLQELVPNSNKSDKASMLDEIIEYVKFLQLQVKVLSMSRLGATGAVVPLITDSQAEGSNGLLLSPSAAQGADPFESPDNIAFEQEVVKLMESNVNTAMQFLQSKGLCLMPIALATAISGRKASSGPVSADRKKLILTHALVHQNHGPPPPGIGISSYGENFGDKNLTGIHNGEDSRISGCNGTVIKQEEVKNTICSSSELKPKT